MSKTASISLFQQSLELITVLYAVPGFGMYLFPEGEPRADSTVVIDPISILWHLFRLGLPLLNLIKLYDPKLVYPSFEDILPLGQYTNSSKKAIYHFLVACKEHLSMVEDDLFNISELYKDDTDGFVKVSKTVLVVIERIKTAGKFPKKKSLPFHLLNNSQDNPQDDIRSKVIQELLDTERIYIQSLQELKNYSKEIDTLKLLSKDKMHTLFLNLDQLLDFQRRFLIAMETTLSLPPEDQRIGLLFSQNEMYFQVYEAFCGNYTAATTCATEEASALQKVAHIIDPARGLQSYFIKPVQRLCKYPLLLAELIKYTKPESYAYMNELQMGLEASKRIADRINEQTRIEDNKIIKLELKERVDDWKGLAFDDFGELILNGRFPLAATDAVREYHLFLFQKILLCCKESTTKKKRRKGKEDLSVYSIKGNIFINSINGVSDVSKLDNNTFGIKVFWVNKTDIESFALKCKNIEQVTIWKAKIEKLVQFRRQSMLESGSRGSVHAGYMNLSEESDMDKSRSSTNGNGTPQLPGRIRSSIASQENLLFNRRSVPVLSRSGSYDADLDTSFEKIRNSGDFMTQLPPGGIPHRQQSSTSMYQSDRSVSDMIRPDQLRSGSSEVFRSSLSDKRKSERTELTSSHNSPQMHRRGLESNPKVFSPPRLHQIQPLKPHDSPNFQKKNVSPIVSSSFLFPNPSTSESPESLVESPGRRGSAESRLLAQLQKLKTLSVSSANEPEIQTVNDVMDMMKDSNRQSYNRNSTNSQDGNAARNSIQEQNRKSISFRFNNPPPTHPLPHLPEVGRSPQISKSVLQDRMQDINHSDSNYSPRILSTPPVASLPLPPSRALPTVPIATFSPNQEPLSIPSRDTSLHTEAITERLAGGSFEKHQSSIPIQKASSSTISNLQDHETSSKPLSTFPKLQHSESALSVPGSPSYIRIKVHYEEDIFMVAAPTSLTFQELFTKIEKKIKLCIGNKKELGVLKMQYVDDGGDKVHLAGDEDMIFAFELFQGKRDQIMHIYVT